MPPALDIYVLTNQRDRPTIESFLDAYVDRSASEDRGTETLIMRDAPGGEEPALTLSHVVERGLDYPRRAFTVYLKSKSKAIVGAILAFTTDDQLVLGLSVDDPDEHPENERRARKLLNRLAEQSGGSLGLILVEQPPPLSERAFRQREGVPVTVHFWQRQRAEGHDQRRPSREERT